MDAESWLTGDQAAELFDVKVEEDTQVAALAGSKQFKLYHNVPQTLKAAPKNNVNNDEKKMKMELDLALALA